MAELLVTRTFDPNFDMEAYRHSLEELAQDWPTLKAMLDANAAKVAEVVRALPDEDLNISVAMPWGEQTIAQMAAYPFWNACYHEGQINFIAALLD